MELYFIIAAAAATLSIATPHPQVPGSRQPSLVCQRVSTHFRHPVVLELGRQGIHTKPRDLPPVDGEAMGFRGAAVAESVNGTTRGRTQNNVARTLPDERFRSGGFPTVPGSRRPATFAPKYTSVGRMASVWKEPGANPGGGSSDGGSDGKNGDSSWFDRLTLTDADGLGRLLGIIIVSTTSVGWREYQEQEEEEEELLKFLSWLEGEEEENGKDEEADGNDVDEEDENKEEEEQEEQEEEQEEQSNMETEAGHDEAQGGEGREHMAEKGAPPVEEQEREQQMKDGDYDEGEEILEGDATTEGG